MKYDSGMKYLHKDILDALRSMLGKMGLKEIEPYVTKGSPAELREHLKERHGKCKQSGTVTSDRVGFYNCTTQNFNLEFERLVNNKGEKELTLSWSQVVVFIRNNWDEIYGNVKDEPQAQEEEEQPSPDTVETETALPDTITEGKPLTAVFDYSSLENDTAAALRDCETAIRKETAGYFTLIGAKLKEAQELLADHSNGTFEQWYTALGFKRQTVYNLIQRYEFLSSPTIGGREEAFEALPVTLSYEISKPTAPPELVEKVLDGDITSNAEYKKLKAELDEANRKAEFWINANSETNKENQQLRADRVSAMNRADNAERELKKAQSRIKELESRPVEVAVQPDTAALEEKDRLIEKLKAQVIKDDDKLSELREENAELAGMIERNSDSKVKVWTIKLTVDELAELIEIVKTSGNATVTQAVKKAQMLRI